MRCFPLIAVFLIGCSAPVNSTYVQEYEREKNHESIIETLSGWDRVVVTRIDQYPDGSQRSKVLLDVRPTTRPNRHDK
jgi:hypothetical protein